MDPFEVFPEEIWEIILEKVENPQDARNVLKASKKLEERFQRKKPLWLLDQVLAIPRFIKFADLFANPNNLLNLRKVSKPWRHSVDTHLQKMRSLRPWHYDEPCPSTLKEWISSDVEYYFEDGRVTYWTAIGDTLLMTAGDIQKFIVANESRPPEVSPFPAKTICLWLSDFEGEEDLEQMNWGQINENAHVEFNRWLECLRKLFEKFGRHIHTLKLKLALFYDICHCTSMNFFNGFMEVIRLLSNLKEIVYVASDYDRSLQDRYLVASRLEVPLESLTLTGFKDPISTAFLSRFGHLLRKLTITELATQVIQKQANCFLQLRELVIIDVNDAEELIANLRHCSFPKLVKLTVHWRYYENPVEKMLPLLKIFPALKYLELKPDEDDNELYYEENLSMDLEPLPSVEFIVVPFSPKLSYKFLRNFPGLKEIKFLAGSKWVWRYERRKKSDDYPELHEKILKEKMYESNIWSLFPKLQVVRVEWDHYYEFMEGKLVDFHRFDYNRYKQFMEEFEALMCVGCDEMIGYQNRASGEVYCSDEGHPFGCFMLAVE